MTSQIDSVSSCGRCWTTSGLLDPDFKYACVSQAAPVEGPGHENQVARVGARVQGHEELFEN